MYQIRFKSSAYKELQKLPKHIIYKVLSAIEDLSENPRPSGVKKLIDSKENLYRIRIGDYRVIYKIDETIKIINVRNIGHRKDIYK